MHMYFKRQQKRIPTVDSVETRLPMSSYTVQIEQHSSPTRSLAGEGEQREQLYVLGIPLHKTSQSFQFLYGVIGVMSFYLLYGYIQVLT